jgi:glucose-6-phosphate-specific signal transduction histidine kinase
MVGIHDTQRSLLNAAVNVIPGRPRRPHALLVAHHPGGVMLQPMLVMLPDHLA